MKTAFLLLITVSVILSCDSKKSESSETTLSEAIDQSLGDNVDKFTGKLDELLTLEIASDALGYEPEKAKKEYSQVLKNPKTHSVSYEWDMGRIKEIKIPGTTQTISAPQSDQISLSWLQAITKEQFNQHYRTPTQEELKRADEAMKTKMDEMVAAGKINANQAKMGQGMASSMGSGLSFTDIDGVGTQAKWNNKNQELVVLTKGIMFQIKVDTEDSEEMRKQKSIKAAKRIIKEKL
jgi:hypothetical protein